MLLYLLKVNCLLVIFVITYWIFLRRGQLLQLNRGILLASILLAFTLPTLPLGRAVQERIPAEVLTLTSRPAAALANLAPSPETSGQEALPETEQAIPPDNGKSGIALSSVFWWLYFVVAGALLLLLLRQFVHVFGLILYSTNTRQDGLTLVHTNEDIPPFSFFRFLVINPAKYGPADLHNIIVHEKVHIRQRHYLDILVGELLRVVCWYNPAAWALNGLLKINLEFIADREVLAAGIDRQGYQFQLLRMTTHGQSLRLTTPLNYSPIKLRISMMNTKSSHSRGIFNYALLLPVLCFSALLVNPALELPPALSESATTTATEPSSTEAPATLLTQKEDILFVIRPSIKRQVLMDIKETLAERGVTVTYEKLDYENNRLENISVSIRSADYSYNLSYNPITGPLVFYDLQRSGGVSGFEYGTPDHFDLDQQVDVKNTTGLLIRLPGDRVIIRGSSTIN